MITTQLPALILADLRRGLRTTVALTQAASWSEAKSDRALVLEGATGSGKSLAAAWAFQFSRHRARASEAGMTAWPVWCDARLTCALVGHEWRRETEWRQFDAAPLIVIDDVGTEDEPRQMRALLERAWNVASGRVVITTNVAPDAFAARYGDRVFSRVAGSARWAATASKDMRLEAPSSEPYRRPEDETESEWADRREAEELARQEAEEWERNRVTRERAMAELMRRISDLTGATRHAARPDAREDDERRDVLRSQVEMLRERNGV